MLIIVLGMHRSGTSATAGLLSLLGINVGENLLPQNEFNLKGYFVPKSIVETNDAILKSLDSSWYDISELDIKSVNSYYSKEHLTSILAKEFNPDSPAKLIKDPRLCKTLPIWKAVFAEYEKNAPYYIVTLRHPDEVIHSLKYRDNMSINHAALLYISYLLDAEFNTRGEQRHLLCYNELTENTLSAVNKVGDFLKKPLLDDTSDKLITNFISSDLNHHKENTITKKETPPSLELARHLFEIFKKDFHLNKIKRFDNTRKKYKKILAQLEPWLSKSKYTNTILENPNKILCETLSKNAVAVLYWQTNINPFSEEKTSRTPFHFTENKQTLSLKINLSQEKITALRLDITDRPAFCRIHSIKLYNEKNALIWNSLPQEKEIFYNFSQDVNIISSTNDENDYFDFIISGNDPNFHLKIDNETLEKIDNDSTLIIETTILTINNEKSVQSIKKWIKNNKREINNLNNKIKEKELSALENQKKNNTKDNQVIAMKYKSRINAIKKKLKEINPSF